MRRHPQAERTVPRIKLEPYLGSAGWLEFDWWFKSVSVLTKAFHIKVKEIFQSPLYVAGLYMLRLLLYKPFFPLHPFPNSGGDFPEWLGAEGGGGHVETNIPDTKKHTLHALTLLPGIAARAQKGGTSRGGVQGERVMQGCPHSHAICGVLRIRAAQGEKPQILPPLPQPAAPRNCVLHGSGAGSLTSSSSTVRAPPSAIASSQACSTPSATACASPTARTSSTSQAPWSSRARSPQ